jgi:hypothetical protein
MPWRRREPCGTASLVGPAASFLIARRPHDARARAAEFLPEFLGDNALRVSTSPLTLIRRMSPFHPLLPFICEAWWSPSPEYRPIGAVLDPNILGVTFSTATPAGMLTATFVTAALAVSFVACVALEEDCTELAISTIDAARQGILVSAYVLTRGPPSWRH